MYNENIMKMTQEQIRQGRFICIAHFEAMLSSLQYINMKGIVAGRRSNIRQDLNIENKKTIIKNNNPNP